MTPTKVLGVRLTEDERKLVDAACSGRGQTATEWAREQIIARAEVETGRRIIKRKPLDRREVTPLPKGR